MGAAEEEVRLRRAVGGLGLGLGLGQGLIGSDVANSCWGRSTRDVRIGRGRHGVGGMGEMEWEGR